MTAHYLTTDAHAQLIQPGDWMLVHGVGGGTCQWAAQMAKIRGYKVGGGVEESPGVSGFWRAQRLPGRQTVDERRCPVQF